MQKREVNISPLHGAGRYIALKVTKNDRSLFVASSSFVSYDFSLLNN